MRKLSMAGSALALIAATCCSQGQTVPQQNAPNQGLNTPATQAASERSGKSGETPLDTPAAQASKDASAVASPVAPAPRGVAIRVGTDVQVRVTENVSSGRQINGDTVHGTLAAAVRTSAGVLPVGTAVTGTVVSAAKAGEIASGGVLSVQLTRVGGVHVITDVRDFNGAEGHKDVADAAPAKGSEAMVAAGTLLHFQVMEEGKATGLVPGVPPAQGAGQGNGNQANGNQGNGQQAPSGQPSTGPGVNQTPVGGATQGVVPQGSSPR